MWTQIPAVLIAGELTFLAYHSPSGATRLFLAGAVAFGFLSHLVLDEIYSVDFRGLTLRLKPSAGTR